MEHKHALERHPRHRHKLQLYEECSHCDYKTGQTIHESVDNRRAAVNSHAGIIVTRAAPPVISSWDTCPDCDYMLRAQQTEDTRGRRTTARGIWCWHFENVQVRCPTNLIVNISSTFAMTGPAHCWRPPTTCRRRNTRCIEFMIRNLDVSNCVAVLKLADQLSLERLLQDCINFIGDHFQLLFE